VHGVGNIDFLRKVYPSMEAVLWYRIGNHVYYFEEIEQLTTKSRDLDGAPIIWEDISTTTRLPLNQSVTSQALREIALTEIYRESVRNTQIDIDPRARIGSHFVLDHGVGTVIGRHCIVGNNCVILHSVNLGAGKAGTADDSREKAGQRHPEIGNNVKISGYVSILGNIKIGDNCQIGTRCLITESLPENSSVRVVNMYQIRRDHGQSQVHRSVHEIFGVTPGEDGVVSIYGEWNEPPCDLEIVDQSGNKQDWLHAVLESAGTKYVTGRVSIKTVPFGLEEPKKLRSALISLQVKIRFDTLPDLYVAQSAGFRRAVEKLVRQSTQENGK
jgi:serine acetyltransferase